MTWVFAFAKWPNLKEERPQFSKHKLESVDLARYSNSDKELIERMQRNMENKSTEELHNMMKQSKLEGWDNISIEPIRRILASREMNSSFEFDSGSDQGRAKHPSYRQPELVHKKELHEKIIRELPGSHDTDQAQIRSNKLKHRTQSSARPNHGSSERSSEEILSTITFIQNHRWKIKVAAALIPAFGSVFLLKSATEYALQKEVIFIILAVVGVSGWLIASSLFNKYQNSVLNVPVLISFLSKTRSYGRRLLYIDLLKETEDPTIEEEWIIPSLINSLENGHGSKLEFMSLQSSVTTLLSNIASRYNQNIELIKALRSKNPDIRSTVAQVFSETGIIPKGEDDKAYYFVALEQYKNVSELGEVAREALVNALKYSNDPDSREDINKILSSLAWEPTDDEGKIARYVTTGEWGMVQQMGAAAIHSCIAILHEDSNQNKEDAVKTLARILVNTSLSEEERRCVVEGVIFALADRSWSVSYVASQALSYIGEPAVPTLIKIYKEILENVYNEPLRSSGKISGAIQLALIEIGSPAIPYVEKMLGETDLEVLARNEIIEKIRKR